MIYGWGRKSKDWAMPDGRTLICSYSYVSLMFVFKFVWSRKWHLIGRDRALDIETTRADMERMYGPGNVPDIGIFERFGMFITGGLIVIAALGSMAVQTVFGTGDSTVAAGTLAGDPVAVVIDSDEEITDQSDDSITDDGSSDASADNASPGESDSSVGESSSDESTSDSASSNGGGSGSDDAGDSASSNASDSGSDDGGGSASNNGSSGAAEPGEAEPASVSIYETAQVSGPVGDQSFVSTNVGNPTQGWSDLTVHRAYATSIYGESQADPGEKYLAVEYQLLGATRGMSNAQDAAFRLDVDGVYYSPTLTNLNVIVFGGEVINSVVVFTIPADVADLRFEVGALDPDADGYQASFDMALSAAEAPEPPVRFPGPDQAGVVTRLSELNEFTGVPGMSQQPPLEIEVLGASATARVGPDAAEPGFKFLLVEVQARGKTGYSNIQDQTFRVMAEGELYTGFADLNQVLSAGESWNGVVRFEVPAEASIVELEVGTPAVMEDGHSALFEITLN